MMHICFQSIKKEVGRAFTIWANSQLGKSLDYDNYAGVQCVDLKKLKKKTYYVRVRGYAYDNGKKVFGAWSTVKKIKIKK